MGRVSRAGPSYPRVAGQRPDVVEMHVADIKQGPSSTEPRGGGLSFAKGPSATDCARCERETMSIMRSTEHAGCTHRRLRLVSMIAGIVVELDAVTKAIAAHALAGGGVVNLLGGHFHLELYRNFAGPGNILRGHPVLVSFLSLAAVGLILVAAWSVRTNRHAVAIGLLLGGGSATFWTGSFAPRDHCAAESSTGSSQPCRAGASISPI
jgi:hypothetical protein